MTALVTSKVVSIFALASTTRIHRGLADEALALGFCSHPSNDGKSPTTNSKTIMSRYGDCCSAAAPGRIHSVSDETRI